MYLKEALLGLFCYFSLLMPAKGQQALLSADSILLEEVTVLAFPLQKFAAGNKTIQIDSANMARFRGNTLSELLQQNTPIYLKTYGNGMISTISMRGTSASHTAVLWNGVNINSMSLGLTDFSIVPIFGIDKISINPGASSALYGSDAIGGSINLGSQPEWVRGFKASLQQEVGSFGNYNTSLTTRYGKGKFEGRTSFLHKSLENNFPYVNTTRLYKPVERQENASIQQNGLIQDIYFRISPNQYLAVNTWWNASNREVQPTMSARNRDWQKDRNIKLMAQYHYNTLSDWKGQFKVSYFNDLLNFNGSISRIGRYHAAFEQDIKLINKLDFKVGADWNHIIADISGYGSPVSEDRNDAFILSRYRPSSRLLLSLNVRQPFVSGFKAPLAPSLGAEYKLWEVLDHQATWKANVSQNYRIPTLNDRFWLRGGNKDLLPERSHNFESGILYQVKKDLYTGETEITGYFNDVQNWIAWIPLENYWTAQNIKRVKVRGVEVVQNSSWNLAPVLLKLNLSYAYSKSTNEQSNNKEEIGKQLVYMPLHTGHINSEIKYKEWFFSPLINYTGERFTTSENAKKLPAYMLVDVFIGRDFRWKTYSLTAFLRVNNISNKIYQNYEHRAMPGRNYMLSARISIL
ncbi:MAG: TonB-dependent receptor plug domain-containing protein [Bacteroidota bacterium]|nr:TonB-dependent receptor plug domain-containing protein [Bacteroidota bacterium]